MYAFAYHRPSTVRQAQSALHKHEDSKLLAGGQTLLPTMKQRLASPSALIDLGHVAGLSGIEKKGRNIVIGAMTRHADVAASALVHEHLPALSDLAGGIGDPAVRHRGTIGGSLANNDPSADYPAAALALGATIITNKRKIAADDFFQGMFTTALEDGEIITKVSFPMPSKAAYVKFPNPASRYAMVGVFVAKKGSDVRVAVTGASNDGVFRASPLEAALQAKFNAKSLDGVGVDHSAFISDIHGSSEYRGNLVSVMAKRAVLKAQGK
jgi:carbon-monoxide dehydrogenase medium subunit